MSNETCMFKIDEKSIDVIFEVCCMALHLIEGGLSRNQRLCNSYFEVYRKNKKLSYHLAGQLWDTHKEYERNAKELKSVMKTLEGVVQMQFDKCSFGFEVSGIDVPLEHMNVILSYAREYRST